MVGVVRTLNDVTFFSLLSLDSTSNYLNEYWQVSWKNGELESIHGPNQGVWLGEGSFKRNKDAKRFLIHDHHVGQYAIHSRSL